MLCLVLGNHFIFDFFGPFSASNAAQQDFGTESVHIHQPVEGPHLRLFALGEEPSAQSGSPQTPYL